jgi:hypothetical protein
MLHGDAGLRRRLANLSSEVPGFTLRRSDAIKEWEWWEFPTVGFHGNQNSPKGKIKISNFSEWIEPFCMTFDFFSEPPDTPSIMMIASLPIYGACQTIYNNSEIWSTLPSHRTLCWHFPSCPPFGCDIKVIWSCMMKSPSKSSRETQWDSNFRHQNYNDDLIKQSSCNSPAVISRAYLKLKGQNKDNHMEYSSPDNDLESTVRLEAKNLE